MASGGCDGMLPGVSGEEGDSGCLFFLVLGLGKVTVRLFKEDERIRI